MRMEAQHTVTRRSQNNRFHTGLKGFSAGLLAAILSLSLTSISIAGEAVLEDPVAFGAWLYETHCVRCHGDYGDERLAGEFEDDGELRSAFERDRCRIKWGRRYGGKLGGKESRAIFRFMRVWEDGDGPPDLPELPPLPAEDLPPPKHRVKRAYILEEPADQIDPSLKGLLEINTIANGA